MTFICAGTPLPGLGPPVLIPTPPGSSMEPKLAEAMLELGPGTPALGTDMPLFSPATIVELLPVSKLGPPQSLGLRTGNPAVTGVTDCCRPRWIAAARAKRI